MNHRFGEVILVTIELGLWVDFLPLVAKNFYCSYRLNCNGPQINSCNLNRSFPDIPESDG